MKIEWKTCFKIGISIFLLYLCITYWQPLANIALTMLSAGMPLLIGCVIAYLVNILMSFYEKHYFTSSKHKLVAKSRRPVCMLASFATLILVVFVIIRLVVPQLFACIQLILAEIPDFIEKVVTFIDENELLPAHMVSELGKINWDNRIEDIIQMLTTGVGNVVELIISALSSLFSLIVTTLLSLMFSIYLLLGKEKLQSQFKKLEKRYLNHTARQRLGYVLGVLNESFHSYVVGQCLEAVVIGVLCTLGMMILGLPYAAMIGALTAFTALIPVAGAYIGAITGAFMILTVSPVQAVIFLIFIVVLQQIETNLIYPKVVGASMGLPGIWVLASVTVGGGVMGILGMMLSVPLAASIYRLISDDVHKTA